MENMNEFELHDFIDDPNFDQFIDLIRGENEDPIANFNCDDLVNGGFVDNQQFMSVPTPNVSPFGFDGGDPNSNLLVLPSFDEEEMVMLGDEEYDREDSSGTTTTTTGKRGKADRSRTLISERRRRGRMKEKLYALRSLVPNITKMDKASIVGDAVLYVQDLQMQAKKLKSEIAGLEASLAEAERFQGSNENTKKTRASRTNHSIPKTIVQLDMFQVEEKGFYVKVVSNKGEGAAVSLYKALESLTSFNVHTSNLVTVSDQLILTFTLNVVKGSEQETINLPNLKLWVTGAFLNQGFDLLQTPISS
ncbi:hypothetical protein UlMin_028986 [Ulmus minor]